MHRKTKKQTRKRKYICRTVHKGCSSSSVKGYSQRGPWLALGVPDSLSVGIVYSFGVARFWRSVHEGSYDFGSILGAPESWKLANCTV